jgi:hypothetical protein
MLGGVVGLEDVGPSTGQSTWRTQYQLVNYPSVTGKLTQPYKIWNLCVPNLVTLEA